MVLQKPFLYKECLHYFLQGGPSSSIFNSSAVSWEVEVAVLSGLLLCLSWRECSKLYKHAGFTAGGIASGGHQAGCLTCLLAAAASVCTVACGCHSSWSDVSEISLFPWQRVNGTGSSLAAVWRRFYLLWLPVYSLIVTVHIRTSLVGLCGKRCPFSRQGCY